jgi:hypothetical protein
MAVTTVKLTPFKSYISNGDMSGGRHYRDMEVNVVFTPDASRYVVRGQYTPVGGSCYSETYVYELVDNFGQMYRLHDNLNSDSFPRSRIALRWDGSKEITLELHTIDGDDTREHYKTQPIERRGYYAPLPADIIDEIKTSVDTTGSSFGYAFTPALMRAYANARSGAALKEKDARIATLEARVKELEAIESKVTTLESKVTSLQTELHYAAIPRIHILSYPTPIPSDDTLLKLEDFFAAPSDTHTHTDIGNLPEFVHDAE